MQLEWTMLQNQQYYVGTNQQGASETERKMVRGIIYNIGANTADNKARWYGIALKTTKLPAEEIIKKKVNIDSLSTWSEVGELPTFSEARTFVEEALG